MFDLPSFIRSIFVFIVIFAVIFAVTKFSNPIKDQMGSVLGTKIEKSNTDLPEDIQKEVGASLEGVKDKALETDANDIMAMTAHLNKVIKDYQNVQKEIEKQVTNFLKPIEEKKKEK